jgi:predicted MFS family arabinose efflux permease
MALAVSQRAPLLLVALPFLVSAVARGAFEPAADAMVADVVAPEARPRAYALMRIGRNAGWAIGPALGGLAGEGRFAELALAASGLGFLNLVLSARSLGETPHTSRASARFELRDLTVVARDGRFGRLCLLTAGQFVLFSHLLLSVSVDLAARLALTSAAVGAVYTLNGGMVVLLQATLTRAASDLPPTRALALGTLLYGAGFLVIGAAGALPTALLGMAVFTIGEMIVIPLSAALAADIAPADRRGRYLGVFGLFVDGGHGLGQVTGGLGLAAAAPHPLRFWWMLMAFAALVAVGYLRFDAAPRVDAPRGPALQ